MKLIDQIGALHILFQLLLQSMLERQESRGAHYRKDYPTENPDYNERLFISQDEEQTMSFEFLDK